MKAVGYYSKNGKEGRKMIVTYLLPALGMFALLRLLAAPIRAGWKLLLHGGCGFLCLWLINTTQSFTGIAIPINAVTVLVAGVLGLPGMALLAVV